MAARIPIFVEWALAHQSEQVRSLARTALTLFAQTAHFSTEHCPSVLESRATGHGLRGMILQNKPNFQKTKMNPNLYSEMTYENKPPSPPLPKQTQSKPKQTQSKP